MKTRSALSMTELLICMLIMMILAGMVAPVFTSVRAKANQAVCISNLRQVGMALELYHADWDEYAWQGNRSLLLYLGTDNLKCPLVDVGNPFASYVVCANVRPLVEVWNGERLDHREDLLSCRAIRNGEMPLAIDVNHLPHLIRPDNELTGFAIVLRAAGNVTIVSRKRHAEVMNAMLGEPHPVPCHKRYPHWNL